MTKPKSSNPRCTVAFQYEDNRIVRFGHALKEQDAHRVVATIYSRCKIANNSDLPLIIQG